MNSQYKDNDFKWIFQLKHKVPLFLKKLEGKYRQGFYRYSLTGDFLWEKFKWGLGNSVFFLKSIYTLDLENEYQTEVNKAIRFILSFQRKDGSFYDPMVKILYFLNLTLRSLMSLKKINFNYELNKRAESRQALSSIFSFNRKTQFEYNDIPKKKEDVKKYLKNLNWEYPWAAGSHFSHLLFFLTYSNLSHKDKLINYAIDFVQNLQRKEDGFWYKGNPSIQQRINGAMKIITALKVSNQMNFEFPKTIIDGALASKNNKQACDNFNIVYILKYCNELTDASYRYSEIRDFMLERLRTYKEYYYPKIGGFSFYKNRASSMYYGAYLSKGRHEPDIHGTHLFLWGISIIAQVLNINNDLMFKEIIP